MNADGPTLLIGYDGSDGARRAVEHAGALMSGRRALVCFVSPAAAEVLPGSDIKAPTPAVDEAAAEFDAAMTHEADRIAAEGARLAQAAGLQASPQAISSDTRVWPTLIHLADEHRAATVVVGSRGLSGLRSAVLGSVSHGILQHSERSVLVVPSADVEHGGGPVVLCYDGSEDAERSIDRAGELLAPRAAIALTAWTSAAHLAGLGTAALPKEVVREACARLDEEAERRARETAGEGAQHARDAGFTDVWPLAAPVEANVWATLAGVATQRGAGVIVLGSRGRSAARTALLGSVSRGVATHAAAPVLVVPPGGAPQ